VTAVARRGPAEVKFDRKELENVIGYLDLVALDAELERVKPDLRAIGQDIAEFRAMIHATVPKGEPVTGKSCFDLHFLSSPTHILGGERGRVRGLQLEENILVMGHDGEVRARGSGIFHTLDVDTVIFAIGDVVDIAVGLPVQNGEFVKNQQPRFPVDGISYEAFDPRLDQVIPDVFLAGWARRASTGLVGIARKDAINATQAVIQYLQTQSPTTVPVSERLRERLARLEHPVVDKQVLQRLEYLERERARELSLETFKFGSNREMLEVLRRVSA
jgi:ferredoxin--NADP+ reductase